MSERWIACPVTGRRWPSAKRSELKTCTACGALIDIRHEAWRGDHDEPLHPGPCPPRVAGTPADAAVPHAKPPKLTGKEILEEIDARRDRVHEAALERASRPAKAISNGTHP